MPSIASTPAPSAPRSSRKAEKHDPNATGSSSRNTRENVSWLGTPLRRPRNAANSARRSRPKCAKSTQLSAPQIDAVSAITSTSTRSCRWALPVRGSESRSNAIRN